MARKKPQVFGADFALRTCVRLTSAFVARLPMVPASHDGDVLVGDGKRVPVLCPSRPIVAFFEKASN